MDTSGIADILSITVPMMAQKQALAEQQETVICAAAQTLPDDVAAQAPLLYPAWDWQSCKRDMIVNYNGQLYRVLNTPTDNRPPDAAGMLAIYRPIVPAHAGTTADPIPWVMGWIARPGCITAMRINCGYASRIWLLAPGYRARLQRCGRRSHDLQPDSSSPYLHWGCNHISDIGHVNFWRGLINYIINKERSTCQNRQSTSPPGTAGAIRAR